MAESPAAAGEGIETDWKKRAKKMRPDILGKTKSDWKNRYLHIKWDNNTFQDLFDNTNRLELKRGRRGTFLEVLRLN